MTLVRRVGTTLLALAALAGCGGGEGPSLAERGAEIARARGCVSCHSVDGTAGAGPTWKGLAGSDVVLDDGTTVKADRAFLEEAIRYPSRTTVKGFQPGLMETVIKPESVPPDDVRALIAYIESLGP